MGMSPVWEHHVPVMCWHGTAMSQRAEGVWRSVHQEHKGRVESIHWEFREKEHQGLGMQEGWKHHTLRVREGGEHRTLGLQGGWHAGDNVQGLGLM